MSGTLEHERILVTRGSRSRLPIIVAVHSTALGQAAGGCRMWSYRSWQDGLADALRLSEAMTLKAALAGLTFGGGKSVIVLPEGAVLDPTERRAAMLDLGDAVDSLDGTYGVAEDVGTTAEDMLIASERTRYAYCLPASAGGAGEPSEPTAVGVYAALLEVCRHRFGAPSVAGLRCTVIGLGQVGSRLARRLAAEGGRLVVTDVDPSKRGIAEEIGASWVEPEQALRTATDLIIPAALGGILTPQVVAELECRAIVGPANNQLASDEVADLLAARGVLWAPDFLVNAGGVIFGALVDALGWSPQAAMTRVEAIADTLSEILETAARRKITPHAAAIGAARSRVHAAEDARATVGTPTTVTHGP